MMSIIQKLRRATDLSSSERNIAEYILKHPHHVLNMNARALAMETYTSPSTVIRLCQKIDVGGFPDLKIQLAMELNQYSNDAYEFDQVLEIEQTDDLLAISKKILQIDQLALQMTQEALDIQTMEKVIKHIKEAEVIDFYGVGSSALVARDAYYKFLRLGKICTAHAEADHQEINARLSTDKHLAVFFSYTGQTKQLLSLTKILHAKGTHIVSITGLVDNDLRLLSDDHLTISTKELNIRYAARSSRTAMFYMLDVLYYGYINYDYENNTKRLIETYIPKN